MPTFDASVLSKEIEVGGRKIPLLVPVVGGGIAVLLVIVAKVKGSGPKAQPAGDGGQAQSPAEQGGTLPVDTVAEFNASLQSLQGDIAAQMAAAQGQVADVKGQLEGVTGQVAAYRQSMLESLRGTEAQVSGIQRELSGQITGVQNQLEAQSNALTTGLASAQQAQASYAQQVNARVTAVESSIAQLNQRVAALGTQSQGLTRDQKFAMGQGLGFMITNVLGPISQRVGTTQWETRQDATSGAFYVRPQGGQWAALWG